jgi:putative ABC transport system ATP-binding protein
MNLVHVRYEIVRTMRNRRGLAFSLVLFYAIAGSRPHARSDGISFRLYFMGGMATYGALITAHVERSGGTTSSRPFRESRSFTESAAWAREEQPRAVSRREPHAEYGGKPPVRLPGCLIARTRWRREAFRMSITALPTKTAAVVLDGVTKIYGRGEGRVRALDDVSVVFESGTFTAIMGPSGSGKTTLVQAAAGLDRPDRGSVRIGDAELTGMREPRLARLRRRRVGFVFQSFNLLPSLTAEQNVVLPLRLAGRRPRRSDAREALARVGLGDRARHRPAQLSGGQQQRVAIARALICEPDVIFADEPTGALDTRSAREVLGILRQATDREGRTLVMVTHDPVAAAVADRVLFLADGRIVDEMANPRVDVVSDRLTELSA